MNHPQELVNRYGAKAGILMYVAEHLPDIPQARMVVKTPAESVDEVLKRAYTYGISWPRIFRSSAVAELYGYEGDFPTFVIEDFETEHVRITNPLYCGPYSRRDLFDAHVRETIDKIETSPRWLKERPGHDHLPDRICIIVAEKSPSKIVGTYIKHPNQDDFYVASCTVPATANGNDAYRSNYTYRPLEGVQHHKGFTARGVERTPPEYLNQDTVKRELEEALRWHDRIVALPEMDSGWSYQVEFGLDPLCLYQVRPFKQREIATFHVKPTKNYTDIVVIGITPPEGLRLRVERNVWVRHNRDEPINPDNQPSVFYGEMRGAYHTYLVRNLQANILRDAYGFLSHNDVKAMRRAQVTGLFSDEIPETYHQGEWVTLVADGRNIRILKK